MSRRHFILSPKGPGSMLAPGLSFLLETDEGTAALALAEKLVQGGGGGKNQSKIALIVSRKTGVSVPVSAFAVGLTILRRRAEKKFSPLVLDSSGMVFDCEGLEMASNPVVSLYRAKSFDEFGTVLDLCSGVGIDSIMLASRSGSGDTREVIGVDSSPERVFMACWNGGHCGLNILEGAIKFVEADALDDAFLSSIKADAVFADPGRRDGTSRTVILSGTRPPTDVLARKVRNKVSENLCIKSAPGVSRVEPLLSECVSEFISLDGELRECALWFGAFMERKKQEAGARIATALPTECSISSSDEVSDSISASIGAFILEPDPSVIRAGLVQHLAARTSASRIDEKIAYLTCEKEPEDSSRSGGLFKPFRVVDDFPFSLSEVKTRVREFSPKVLVVKKRGSAVEVESFRKRIMASIKPKEDALGELIIFLTRNAGKPWAIAAERITCN